MQIKNVITATEGLPVTDDVIAVLWGSANRRPFPEMTLEDTPPIEFIASGKAFTDYRIYGAAGGVGDAVTGGRQIPVTVADGTLTRSYTVTFEGDPLYERDYVSFSDQKVYRTIRSFDGTIQQGNLVNNDGKLVREASNQRRLCCSNQSLPFAGYVGKVWAIVETSSTDKVLDWWTWCLKSDNTILGYGNEDLPVVEGSEKIGIVIRAADDSAITPSDITSVTFVTEETFPTSGTVSAPQITPYKGENTLSVGTAVQPEKVQITGRIRQTAASAE